MKKTLKRREVHHEYWKGDRRATVILDSEKGWEVEMFKDDGFEAYTPLHNHSESYAESCAENWVEGIIPLDSEHLHKREEKEGSFYGYKEKSRNFDPEIDD